MLRYLATTMTVQLHVKHNLEKNQQLAIALYESLIVAIKQQLTSNVCLIIILSLLLCVCLCVCPYVRKVSPEAI